MAISIKLNRQIKKMRISSRFNRFMHGVILDEISHLRYLKITPKMAIRPFYLQKDTIKQLLKWLDSDYPRDKDLSPLSYTKLNESDFLSHIAFIETLMAENGYTPHYIQQIER